MATGLTNVGHAFGGPPTSSTFQSTSVDDDDDVVFIEPVQVAQNTVPVDQRNVGFRRVEAKSVSSTKDLDSLKGTISETIIIDDEEDSELNQVQDKNASSLRSMDSNRSNTDFSTPTGFSRNKGSTGMMNVGITTEPDSEIQIANVTTLETGISSMSDSHVQNVEGRDMNLMITHVTSLQNPSLAQVPNGVNVQTYPPPPGSQSKTAMGPYNPGRINVSGEVFQNGESATHPNPDSWISQSASFPRNQKQPVVDSLSPVASLPKQVMQPSPQQQQPSKAVKVTCANCKKPLQKGQTAYQRKGSTHLFCSTACLSSFSHKPAPKKLCTMCKKDITTMKGTIVAQVDSSESFQEFCSTYCLSVYEDKQNSAKNQNKSRCTICGKLTEIRHEVSFKNMTHKLCSDHCFNRYRMANGLIMNCCEQCGEYLPSKGAGNNILMVEGQWKRFCSPVCLSDFKMKHGKLTSCTGCKAQCRCFDMTQCIGTNGHMEPYCSTVCMNNHKAKLVKPQNMGIICHFCKRNSLPQYQATMPDGKMYNFCSSNCVAKFQTLSMQSTQNGQHSSTSDIQLKCNYCKNVFSSKPETLEWENKVSQFCSTNCCEDYKKLHCIVTYCEYCQEEKTLHDTMKFSGVKKPFCSEGCKLLYKQDFARRLGLKCVTCNYCFQMCKRGATKEYDGMLRDFCSEDCSKKFHDWYYKAARCDCCRTQGVLREKVQWRGTIKNFCDPQCLLRFYSQQNEPNMSTQKGPENMHYDQAIPSSRTRAVGINSSTPAVSKDMKNKAVLCKPLSMTKATYCKPHMQTKTCQTEEDDKLNSDSEEKLKQDPEEKLKQDPEEKLKQDPEEKLKQDPEEKLKQDPEEKLKQDPEEKLKQDPEEKLKQDPVEIIKHVPVPIPVPVFVPVPMHLYCRNIPTPTIIPIPVPVPVFLPSDVDSIEKVFAVEESKTKSPLHPTELESNLTLFSEPVVEEPLVSEDISDEEVAEKETLKSCSTESPAALSDAPFEPDLDIVLDFPQGEEVTEKEILESCSTESPAALSDAPFEPDLDIELDFPRDEKVVEKEILESCSTESPAALSDVPYEPDLDIELDFPRATEELDTENEFLLPPVFGEEYEEQPKPQALKKGKKRKAILDFQTHDDCSENSESSFPFKYCYGVNAWKHWVKTRKVNTDDSEESNSTISVKLKEDILLHPPSDLNYWLSQFVNEVRRPNGENYAPDSIYYLCLGIQEFLTGSNRKDNIFVDSDYQDFAEEFNKIIKSWQPSILPDGSIFSRLEEDYLWQLNQLGSHSPTTLLFTLFYFNTKYFNLKTVEQHMRLSFGTVFRQLKKNPLTKENKACLQYQVSSLCENDSEGKIEIGKRKHEDDEPVFEQIENTADPSRCPVKMFEYYLSRSPQNLNQRMDVFYLKPESSASADSPFWYTSTSLDRNTLENMLIRVLLVKDIYEKNSYELDEETD
ncbi:zinc finger MYM-type protein 2 [Bombina bombina]|uniref:zinc finger MYM-type protein 2 n=1 Tax=Bombina bombina TaxID=8345 RepID=UPI00235AD136|nr:zinc finger MYM-type protein 2 [Bombina bombina]XP_053564503.1 zinc finger MYM-type protein 2 [Bombina bombina]XP_053564504.1 zinc finger MYM-type protein 2 [Bombina bombina]XP_053564505.1 zinc finger MYM-type protein 2 [Bombina bombina]XP_053564506.1 zinc finger MYM-type protein 2 [Bombina bombina]